MEKENPIEDEIIKAYHSKSITEYQYYDLMLKLKTSHFIQDIFNQLYQLVDIYSQEKGYEHRE